MITSWMLEGKIYISDPFLFAKSFNISPYNKAEAPLSSCSFVKIYIGIALGYKIKDTIPANISSISIILAGNKRGVFCRAAKTKSLTETPHSLTCLFVINDVETPTSSIRATQRNVTARSYNLICGQSSNISLFFS